MIFFVPCHITLTIDNIGEKLKYLLRGRIDFNGISENSVFKECLLLTSWARKNEKSWENCCFN